MTDQEAAAILTLLNAAFVHVSLEVESAEVYVRELALLSDAQLGWEAAKRLIRTTDRFPTIKDFRAMYHAAAAARVAVTPAVEPPPREPIPEWVHVWWWASHTKEERRAFPQFDPPDEDGLSMVEYEVIRTEWVEAGSPHLREVSDLLATLQRASE